VNRVVEAVVQAGAFETRYVRAGQGPPVVLIVDPPVGAHEWVFRRLAERFRVIAPSVPDGVLAGASAAEGWLEGVMEGLGVESAALVVAEPVDLLLADVLGRNRGSIGRVAILRPMTGDGTPAAEPRAHPRQMVCHVGASDVNQLAIDELVRFLGDR
jgi:hypothetical protein